MQSKMRILLKKVIIIYIVTIITFVSIINIIYQETKDSITQVSIVSAEELSYKNTFAQNVYNQFSLGVNNEQSLSTSIYQLSNESNVQLKNIVNNSDVVIIIGDKFNSYLNELVIEEPDKQFILLENTNDYDYDNTYQISIDYRAIYEYINRLSNENYKSLVIVSNEYSKLSEYMFYETSISTNLNVKLLPISDFSNNVDVEKKISDAINAGYTHVYSLTPYNNEAVQSVIKQIDEDIYNASMKVSEVSSESQSEVSSESQSEVSTMKSYEQQLSQMSLSYLTLNNREYYTLNVDTTVYEYEIKDQLTKVIDGYNKGKLVNGQMRISLTKNEN